MIMETTIGNILKSCSCGCASVELIPSSEDVFELEVVNCDNDSRDYQDLIKFTCCNCGNKFAEFDRLAIEGQTLEKLQGTNTRQVLKKMPPQVIDYFVNYDLKIRKGTKYINVNNDVKVAENDEYIFYVLNKEVEIKITSIDFKKNTKHTKAKLGKVLKEQIKRCGYTRANFAKMINVSDSLVANWTKEVSLETLVTCLNLLGLRVLITGLVK